MRTEGNFAVSIRSFSEDGEEMKKLDEENKNIFKNINKIL